MNTTQLPPYVEHHLGRYPFIPHPKALAVLSELEFLYAHRQDTGDAVGERFAGESNVGKSTLMLEMVRRHPPVKHEDGWHHPIVYLHLPESAKLDDVYVEMLTALGDLAPTLGSMKDKRARARKLLTQKKVVFVFIDEPHHLTESRSDGARLSTSQLGKVLVDLGLTVVFGGVHSVDELVSASSELARRFPGRLYLQPYDVTSKRDLDVLRTFADDLGARLTRVKPVQFGSDNEWFARLAVLSNGFPGAMAKVVLQAESRAHQAGADALTLKHFSQAWARFEHSQDINMKHLRRSTSDRLVNVFELDYDSVAALLGGMVGKG